jgi:hypothetical protein
MLVFTIIGVSMLYIEYKYKKSDEEYNLTIIKIGIGFIIPPILYFIYYI